MNILGINYSGCHESSACLLRDGQVIFACAEERLTRKKQDASFPVQAIAAALNFGGLKMSQIDHVAIGWPMPWIGYKHDLKLMLTGKLKSSWPLWRGWALGLLRAWRHRGGARKFEQEFGQPRNRIHFVNHHLAHALSAYCLSGFTDTSVLVVDGRGAEEATTLWHAKGGQIHLLEQYDYPDSLGVFYAGITHLLGFQPFSDEWKVMGLASYGTANFDLSKLIRVNEDSYHVDGRKLSVRSNNDLSELEQITGPRRTSEELTQRDKDLARSAQEECEKAMMALLRRVTKLTGSRKLCLAGGVALNCKANGELIRSGLIDDIYVQPAAGDDGASIGAAFAVYHMLGKELPHHMIGQTYLGTEYSNEAIKRVLKVYKLNYRFVDDVSQLAAHLLAENNLIGWFQGRMEFGPRALGCRSILSDPRFEENRDRVNEAVKFRESWRPFAPSVLEERGHIYFRDFRPSPYMILSFWATEEAKKRIPAVVHVDGSCRVQSVTRETNPRYYDMLTEFERLAGVGVCMNTSFNLKNDAIVESPKDALQTFFTSGLDVLLIGDYLVSKQPI